jgi:hypothetical protein
VEGRQAVKVETIFNAYDRAEFERAVAAIDNEFKFNLRTRQAHAFRARILRMFAELERNQRLQIETLEAARDAINTLDIGIFGTAYTNASDTGEPYPYPIRDELIYNMTVAINGGKR